jgi:hypothetical protein
MPQREVRFPLPEISSFLHLKPTQEEMGEVYACLDSLKHQLDGEHVPFGQYGDYPDCKVVECGRFLIVYALDEEIIYVLAVLLDSNYE